MARHFIDQRGMVYDSLNSLMGFGRVIYVSEGGELSDASPEIDSPDEILWINGTHEEPGDGWTLMDGYSAQDGYSGPVMADNEAIGGDMEYDILSQPGYYVALVVKDIDSASEDETPEAGWVVAYKAPIN